MNKEEITVLYENNDVVIINKPSGMMVHEGGKQDEKTVVDWFLVHSPESKGVGEPGYAPDGSELERSGVVHRLDQETSGVLVLAKNQKAHTHLKKQFHDRLVKKEYRAIVYGEMREKWGTINRPIGRSGKDFRKRSAQRGAKGTIRDAVTDWELIGQRGGYAYLKVFPRTGRTHQIRAHFKAIGRPIVGDTLYASSPDLKRDNLGLSRLALHAYALTVILPNGEEKYVLAPLPPAFEEATTRIAA